MANDLMLLGIGGSDYSDPLYGIATPSLDLQFAANKSLTDVRSGNNLVTFTRASEGTYVDSTGVIRKATTNLLLRSEEFDDASWIKTGILPFGSGSISDATIAPDGYTTADLITENTDTGFHEARRPSFFVSGLTYTWSVFVKAANGTRNLEIILATAAFPGNPLVVVNTATGQIINSSDINARSQSYPNGWYRVSFSATADATAENQTYFRLVNGASDNYTGDGTSGIYLWGAQLEQSSTVGEYIPTTSTINSAPRFDHDPTTGESLGLLVEEQRTNSIRNNTMVGAVAGTPGTNPTNWSIPNVLNGLQKEIVGTGTTNGITWIDVRWSGTATATGSTVSQPENVTAVTAATGQSWSASAWWAIVGGSTANITAVTQRVSGRSAAGSLLENTDTAVTLTATLTRYAVSRTLTNASTERVTNDIVFSYGNGAAIDITLRIGLPQLELGAFATSVIPTTTAAATRSADVASISGSNFSSWYRQDEGTVFAHYETGPGVAARRVLSINDATANNIIQFIASNGSGLASNYSEVITLGVSQSLLGTGAAYAPGRQTSALAYAVNNVGFAKNGGAALVDLTASIPEVTRFEIGFTASALYLNGIIRRLTYFPQRISNENLQRITQ